MTMESTRGISRMNYATSNNGWSVRYTREGVTFNKLFSDNVYGSPEESRAAAEAYYDELRTVFPPPTYEEFLSTNTPQSGYHGVGRVTKERKGQSYDSWQAKWYLNGKTHTRYFSINKYGDEEAKRLAIEARAEAEPVLEKDYYKRYWNYRTGNRFNRADIVEEPFAYEGAEKFVLHKAAERDRSIRTLKLREFLKEHGKLFCEVCSFNFEETYGQIGRGLIEVHHLIPIAEMEPNHRTTIDELMCICSNCHFAIHNGDATANLKSLKIIFGDPQKQKKKSNKSEMATPRKPSD
jgi:5-methylcytosine-specific restriction endonuclease McrA